MFPRLRLPRPRFSLLTLVLGVLFVGACGGLWYRWEPWVLEGEATCPGDNSAYSAPNANIAEVGFLLQGDAFFVRQFDLHESTMDVRKPRVYPVHVYDRPTRYLRFSFTHVRPWMMPERPLKLSPNGRHVVTYDGTRLVLVDATDGTKAPMRMRASSAQQVCGFAEGGRLFAYIAEPAAEKFELWTRDVETGREWTTQAVPFSYFRYSSKRSWATWRGGAVDLRTGERLPPGLPDGFEVDQAEFDSEGRMLIVSGYHPNRRAALCIWRPGEKAPRFLPLGESSNQPCFTLSPDARWLRVQVGNPGPSAAHVFYLETDTKAIQPPENGWVSNLLPNNRGLYRRRTDPTVWHQNDHKSFVWDYVARKELFELIETEPIDHRSRISKDDRHLISYWPIQSWDLDSGRLVLQLRADIILSEFAPDDSKLLVQYKDARPLTLLDTRTGSVVWTFGGEPQQQTVVAFSPDGNQLIMGCGQDVRLWSRRRPEYWWGIAWLPEFWIALISGGALVIIAVRNLRRRSAKLIASSFQPPVSDSQ